MDELQLFNLFEVEEEDDEEFQWFVSRDPYIILPRINGFVKYTEKKFFIRYRLHKSTVWFLLSKIENRIRSITNRNHAVDPQVKLLMTLRFYAGGLMLLDAGELVGVSKSTACNIIRDVSHAIAILVPEIIKMPTLRNEIHESRKNFYDRARFPRVIGSLDCTHVRIQSPGGDTSEIYRNRKGYFFLNVQTVSSAKLKILDIVVRFPGSVHDQTIYNNSTLRRKLEAGCFGNDSIVVADGGYRNSKYIVTPLRNVNTEVESLYNESVIRTRNPVERLYGVLKRRFPILSLGMRMRIKKIQSIIVACAILHNICIDSNGDYEEPPANPDVPSFEIDDVDDIVTDDIRDAQTARDQLLIEYFPTLLL